MDNNKSNDTNNNKNTAAGAAAEGPEKETQTGTAAGADNNAAEETVTMSKADYQKAIQSAEDRLRTSYTKRIKELEAKVASLTPPEKTDAERDFEQRLADLERKEKENDEKTRVLSLKASLQAHNIDGDVTDFLKADVDADGFCSAIEKIVAARMAAGGYKPSGHQANQPLTKGEYDKMTYDEMVELYRRDPKARERLKR